jgi:putative ABC transport system permease protein
MLGDVRYSTRLIRKSPAFSLTVILTLALGIGLTTAIFSVVDHVLLRPLPYATPSTLVTGPAIPLNQWLDWRRRSMALDDIALFDFGVPQLVFAGQETARVRQAAVSANMLSVLGIQPVIGRDFQPADSDPGAEPVVMISYAAWRQYFGGRLDAVGASAPFDPAPRRVIGVLPANFIFPMRILSSAGVVAMLTPLRARSGQGSTFTVVARLKRGATMAHARAEYLETVSAAGPERHSTANFMLTPLADEILGRSRPSLLMLFGAVGFLLFIACANVGNLLFAKGADARKDLAVRFALGARRRDLARLIFVQSCALSIAGGALGVILAYIGFDTLIALVPVQLPRVGAISLDTRVLAFALALSLLSGAAVGLFPVWYLSRGVFQSVLQIHDRATLPAQRLRLITLTIQIAVAVVLLSAAAIFARSFVRLLRVDLGFAPRDVLTLKVRTLESRYPTVDQQRAFLDEVLAQVATVHGVSSAAAIEMLPVTRAKRAGSVTATTKRGAASLEAEPRVVSPDYFDTMNIGLVMGRSFNRSDVSGAPHVAIINQALARRVWPDANPLGQHIRLEDEEFREIVGVVGDVHSYAIETSPEPQVYTPYSQSSLVPQQLVVRTAGNREALITALRQQIHKVDARASAESIQPLSEHVATSIAQPRFQAWLLSVFAASALVLTIVGIAGVVAYAMSRQKREIAIRIALGAAPRDLLRAILTPSLLALAVGLSIGLGATLLLGRFARAFLFEIEPHDPVTLSAVLTSLGATALAAAWLPCRRATRIDPMIALRAE